VTHRLLPFILVAAGAAAPATAQPLLAAEPAAGAPAAPQEARGTFEYLYDDGAGNVNIGPPSTFDPDMLWGNYFFSDPAGQQITEIAVAFGPTFPSAATEPVTFWLLDDPDADADPRTNASVLRSVDSMPDTLGGNFFFRVPIDPPAEVGAAFFVGASVFLQGGEDRPARVDTDGRADRSWFFYAPDIAAVIDSLAGAPFGTRMDDGTNVPFPGAFMIRAVGQPVVGTSGGPAEVRASLTVSPSPARGVVTLRMDLPTPGPVRLEVLDPLGRVVATPIVGERAAGRHLASWNPGSLPAGPYFARLHHAHGDAVARFVLR
jgi:hypothetical protein